MSALAGIVTREPRPVREVVTCVSVMLDTMPHRGSARQLWPAHGETTRAALGQLRLPHEIAPDDAPRALVCDARLDNAQELREQLGAPANASDALLLQLAYEKWRGDCVHHLLGDWAFAVWDEPRQTLFAARDPSATRAFYFHSGSRFFAFATEIKALLALPDVPRDVNPLRIAEHLTNTFGDATNTFFARVQRLAPAHSLETDGSAPRVRRFYQLDLGRELPAQSDDDYARGLHDALLTAVRDRTRDEGTASLLSGGLDSSTISCLARNVLRERGKSLPVFSGVFPNVPECDETPFIQSVLETGGFSPVRVRGDDLRPISDLPTHLRAMDEPFFAPGFAFTWKLYGAVQRSGARVLLDGHGGDEAISFGDGLLAELAREGRWRELWSYCRGLSRVYGESAWRGWLLYARGFAPHSRSRAPHVRAMRLAVRASNRLPQRRSRTAPQAESLLSDQLAQSVNFLDYKRELDASRVPGSFGRDQTERATHFALLSAPLQAYALENLTRAASHFGLQIALPFWDRRVVEYSLALPGAQKTSPKWTRDVLRRAMQNVLPPQVQWRTSKNDFLPNFARGLRADTELLDALMNDLSEAAPYLDVQVARRAWSRLRDASQPFDASAASTVWSAAQLALWLKESSYK